MRFRPLLLPLLLLLLVLPATSRAQETVDRVQNEIARTDQRIERARAVVTGTSSATALAEVDHAVELQAGARSALAQGKLRIALDMTLRARAAADRAIAIVNGLPDPDRVLSQLERTRDMLERARGRIEECNQDRARALLQTAGDMQKRAEDSAHSGHYLAALQLTMGARERVQRALRQCRVADDAHDGTQHALQRTDEVIQGAQERLGQGPPPRARALLERAVETQARAQQEYRGERLDAALRLTLSARAFAVRAARVAGRAR
jgi:hypothetical protein